LLLLSVFSVLSSRFLTGGGVTSKRGRGQHLIMFLKRGESQSEDLIGRVGNSSDREEADRICKEFGAGFVPREAVHPY